MSAITKIKFKKFLYDRKKEKKLSTVGFFELLPNHGKAAS